MAKMPAFTISFGQALKDFLGALGNPAAGLGYFEHRGVKVRHLGCLANQPRVAEIIDEVAELLGRDHDAVNLLPVLSRISVVVSGAQYERSETLFDVFSEWQGGYFDKGVIYLALVEKWEENLANGLRDLALMELT